jgi:hypothetical protein
MGKLAAPVVGKSMLAGCRHMWKSSVAKYTDSLESNKLRLLGANSRESSHRR